MKKYIVILCLLFVSSCSESEPVVELSSLKINNTTSSAMELQVSVVPTDMQECLWDRDKKVYISCEDIIEDVQEPEIFTVQPSETVEKTIQINPRDSVRIYNFIGEFENKIFDQSHDGGSDTAPPLDMDLSISDAEGFTTVIGTVTYRNSGGVFDLKTGKTLFTQEYCEEENIACREFLE